MQRGTVGEVLPSYTKLCHRNGKHVFLYALASKETLIVLNSPKTT